MDHVNFIYEKHQEFDASDCTYSWCIINKKTRNGVDFSGIKYYDGNTAANSHGFFPYGFEFHRVPDDKYAVTSDDYCNVTLGACAHDGSSRWAMETLGKIDPCGSDDATIWQTLSHVYHSVFVKYSKEEEED